MIEKLICPNCKLDSDKWYVGYDVPTHCMIHSCALCDYRYILRDSDFFLYGDLQAIINKKYGEYERSKQ